MTSSAEQPRSVHRAAVGPIASSAAAPPHDPQELAGLTQVTSELTHQVKNRLQAMMVHVAVLKELLGAAPPEVRRSLDVLEAEINRADVGVNRLARAARPVQIAMRPLDLNSLLDELTTSLAEEWQGKAVALVFTPEPGGLLIVGDEELLRRAFTEMLVDAGDVVRDGGAVTVRTTREQSRAAVLVSAQSSAAGASPGLRGGAVAPGERATVPPLVRRVAEMHDGEVEIVRVGGEVGGEAIRAAFLLPLGAGTDVVSP